MAITFKVALAAPQSVDVTVQLTMTADEWKRVTSQIDAQFAPGGPRPPYELNRVLNVMRDAVVKAHDFFGGTIDEAEDKR